MRNLFSFLLLLLSSTLLSQTPVYDLVPMPVEITPQAGFFDISNASFGKMPAPVSFFEQWVAARQQSRPKAGGKKKVNIHCHTNHSLGKARSVIAILPDRIDITAADDAGFFYAAQTLIQLAERNEQTRIPCAAITDYPRFEWRGLHLDESRHFMGKAFVLKMIDWMAALKMNVFHWHLTDAQGWRIEIKKYPKLTSVGAWRPDRTGILNIEADTAKAGEPMTYGGFYTQNDIREIVQYAAKHQITIIPEIEMPGHSSAALAAYPEFSCTGGPFPLCGGAKNCPYPNFCVGNKNTYRFLEGVLTEVMALFPSRYIHIGGDEVERDQWKKCPRCQHLKDSLGLADEAQLQVYFTKRIETFLIKHGRQLMGWDEIMEGGNLTASAGVMVWRGEELARAATLAGHEVVLAHNYYFDHYQGRPETEPVAAGYRPLEDVYRYAPVPVDFTAQQRQKILGIQSCLWTENINNTREAEYMLFPRVLALAEVAWSPAEKLNWDNFKQRIPGLMDWMAAKDLHFATSVFNPGIHIEPGNGGVVCSIEQQIAHGAIHYTTDGTTPTEQSPLYQTPFLLTKPCEISAAAFWKTQKSKTVARHYKPSLATGKPLQLVALPDSRYNGDRPSVLTDGLDGPVAFHDGSWCGFYGDDFDLLIDLEKIQPLHRVNINWLKIEASWIYLPLEMEVKISEDGKKWNSVYTINNVGIDKVSGAAIKEVSITFEEENARYVRIFAKNPGTHPLYPTGKCWLFVDEVRVK